ISHFGFRYERIRELQSRMEDLHPWKSIVTVIASILTAAILSTGSMVLLARTGTDEFLLPLVLPFAATPPIAAYVVRQLHGRDEVNIIEQDDTDWQWFAATAGLLVLMVLTLSLILTIQLSTGIIT
ncbi:MAG: hypothetical protein SVU32_00160, partial [Candidatus Nanohaloarchaea archaeon]|nr:hypothetical protein [Candidatus Nanohaloarchaea archaeon]